MAILKISPWNSLSMEPYALTMGERVKLKTMSKLGQYTLPDAPFGVQAFTSSHEVDRVRVMDELLSFGLETAPHTDIYAPHHSRDMAEKALLNHGFLRTARVAQYVDILQIKHLKFRQELFLKEAA